jgi:dienelactone hydrolase
MAQDAFQSWAGYEAVVNSGRCAPTWTIYHRAVIDGQRQLCDLGWVLVHLSDRGREGKGWSRLPLFVLLFAPCVVLLCCSCRTQTAAAPRAVATLSRRITLTGKEVPVDFYLPRGARTAPVVVIAHGFTRSRLNMAGWGGLLASNGFIVAIPDLPALTKREQNGRAIGELLDVIDKGEVITQPKAAGGAALMGYSMGGLSALLAASGNPQVRCWIGLDPVNAGRKGAEAAASLTIPCAVLRAEPATWNLRGNARRLARHLTGPFITLRVRDARHSDPEDPTDSLAEMLCGKSDPRRHRTFERYTLATLRAVFFGDPASLAVLRSASADPAVADVAFRKLEDFPADGRVY